MIKQTLINPKIAALGFAASLLVPLILLAPKASAAVDTCTWVGGSGLNTSTAANWTGCDNGNVPENGDNLLFTDTDEAQLNNDNLSSIGNIIMEDYSGSNLASSVTFGGQDFTLNGDITAGSKRYVSFTNNTVTLGGDTSFNLNDPGLFNAVKFGGGGLDVGSHTLTIESPGYMGLVSQAATLGSDGSQSSLEFNNASITSSAGSEIVLNGATLTFSYLTTDNTSFNSNIVATNSIVSITDSGQLGDSSLVLNNSQLKVTDIGSTVAKNLTQNITFNGNLYDATYDDSYLIGKAGLEVFGDFAIELSGSVVLSKDLAVSVASLADVSAFTIAGPLSGPGIVALDSYEPDMRFDISSSDNQSQIPNGLYQVVISRATLTGEDSTTNVIVATSADLILNGVRNNIIVSSGGTLKGSGTAASVLLQSAARLAPGESPGCLNTGDLTLSSGANYDVEIAGVTECSEYDRTSVTGTVSLAGAVLNLSFLNEYRPAVNSSYTVIDNDGSDAVIGEFADLADGTTFEVDGVTMRIHYNAGDGNDVVLIAVTVPDAPDTGAAELLRSPVAAFVALVASFGVLASLRVLDSKKQ